MNGERRIKDVERFVNAVLRLHPDPFRSIARDAFEHEAELAAAATTAGSRADDVCALMRLGALLGTRNGHTGVFPLDDRHSEPLHFHPLRLYEFEDGFFVVSAADSALVGAEVLEIGGVAIASVAQQAEALISRDNEWTVRARRPSYLVAAEVLQGLGVGATFGLRSRSGNLAEITSEPLGAAEYAAAVDADRRLPRLPGVRYLERRDERSWVESLGDGRVFVAYNVTCGETDSLAAEIAALARAETPRSLVLDLRLNGGGDNTTYGPLLSELERRAETAQLVVLTSRITFSAAMQLVVDLEQRTNAIFVGEPTGGSPNQFGDAVEMGLPAAGVVARVATISWETAGGADIRLTRTPDVEVPLRSEDFFAGRDPVLDAASRISSIICTAATGRRAESVRRTAGRSSSARRA